MRNAPLKAIRMKVLLQVSGDEYPLMLGVPILGISGVPHEHEAKS
jgi:hypothetical protein